MFLVSLLLDLVFDIDYRLRQRQAEITAERDAQIRAARARLLEDLEADERRKKGLQ